MLSRLDSSSALIWLRFDRFSSVDNIEGKYKCFFSKRSGDIRPALFSLSLTLSSFFLPKMHENIDGRGIVQPM